MHRFVVVLLGMMCMPAMILIAQERVLTLDQVITIACDSSLSAKKAKNTFLSDYWKYRSYKAARLPSLNLSMVPFRYSRSFTSRYDYNLDRDVYRLQQSLNSNGNLALKQNVDLTGGSFYLDTELGYYRTFGNPMFQQFSSVPLRMGYSQSLVGYNTFKWEKRVEPIKYQRAQRELLYTMEEISETAVGLYFSLIMAQVEYELAKVNMETSDTLYRMGMAREEIAYISEADLLTLKLDRINAGNTLRNAEIGLRKAQFSLLNYLNLNENTVLKLEIPEKPTALDISEVKALTLLRLYNPEYLSNQLSLLEAERSLERTTRSSKLDASLSMSVGFNQVSTSLIESYKKPLDQEVVSLSVNIPLIDWGIRNGNVAMAKSQLNITQISVKQKELDLEENVSMIVSDLNSQLELIRSAEEARKLADLAYTATKERFQIGKADIVNLSMALSRQENARRNYISVIRNYWQSYIRIRKMTLFDFVMQQPLIIDFETRYGIQ